MLHTQTHQSGDITLRSCTFDQDEMRGMDSNIVGDAQMLAKYFDLQDHEAHALKESVLPWLHQNNIWYQAYKSSYREVKQFDREAAP